MNRRAFLQLRPNSSRSTPTNSAAGDPLVAWSATASDRWDYPRAAHLLRRTMVGPTDAEIRRAVAEGLDATLDRLFTTHTPDAAELSDFTGKDARLNYGVTPDEAEWWVIFDRYREWMHHLTRWYLKTLIGSRTSMQEKMTFFWHSHFAMELDGVGWPEYMFESIATLRRGCFGNVRDLAQKMTVDMGMLVYLDGCFNRCYPTWSEINENYARELLELFTVGIVDRDGRPNYTQDDVEAAARSLTGWTFSPSELGPQFGGIRSRFLEESWDPSEKTFLGRTGAWKANDIVTIIFAERAEAASTHIASKLYRFFVHDDLDDAVVDAMARVLRESDWEVRPVLERLLRSDHFLSNAMHGALPRPLSDYYLGTIRQLGVTGVPDWQPGATERTSSDLYVRLRKLGQLPLNPPNVNAWPSGRRWLSASTIPERMLWSLGIVNGELTDRHGAPSYAFDVIAFARSFPQPDDAHALVGDIVRFLLPAPLEPAELQVFVDVLLDGGPDYEWRLDDPKQNPSSRLRKLLAAIVKHPIHQLT
jgi:hypothetical protein